MEHHADLVAFDRLGVVRVLVEVKNKPMISVGWATEFRRNLIAHGRLSRADYFVVATPGELHVWKEPAGPGEPPAVSVDARNLWARYSGRALPQPGSGEAFELIVASWLTDVAQHWETVRPTESDARRLEETGLPEAIRGGRVEHSVAA